MGDCGKIKSSEAQPPLYFTKYLILAKFKKYTNLLYSRLYLLPCSWLEDTLWSNILTLKGALTGFGEHVLV